VSWCTSTGPSREWLQRLFAFLRSAANAGDAKVLSAVQDWPIVPAILRGELVLVAPAVASLSSVLFSTATGSLVGGVSREDSLNLGRQASVDSSGDGDGGCGGLDSLLVPPTATTASDQRVFSLLGRLGVPILDNRVDFSGVGLECSMPTGSVLLRILQSDAVGDNTCTWSDLLPSDISYLLRLWEADCAALSPEQLAGLRRLPVFLVDLDSDDRALSGGFQHASGGASELLVEVSRAAIIQPAISEGTSQAFMIVGWVIVGWVLISRDD